jgi:hypothetical protein
LTAVSSSIQSPLPAVGESVFHFHFTPHEDVGMMQNFLILDLKRCFKCCHQLAVETRRFGRLSSVSLGSNGRAKLQPMSCLAALCA